MRLLVLTTAAVLTAACGDSTGPETDLPAVNLSISAGNAQTAAQLGPGLTLTDAASTLSLTRVAVVLRDIELKRLGVTECPVVAGSEADSCEYFATGPVLLELPLDGSVKQLVAVQVPPATYGEVEFEVHKPSDDDAADAVFLQAHPEFAEVSVRVEGTFNGESFTFEQDLMDKQEYDLSPPLSPSGEGPVNLTMVLDVTTWFRSETGDLVDPRLANKGEEFENLVENNIRASIEVFEDAEQDGRH